MALPRQGSNYDRKPDAKQMVINFLPYVKCALNGRIVKIAYLYHREENQVADQKYARFREDWQMVQKVMNRVSRAGDTSALRKQILADILGSHVDDYENFNRETADKKRQHRTRVPLWKFLLHLLDRDQDGALIKWNKDHLLEFRINDPAAMAILWGSVKNRTDMTYEKFGRAMRYYYGKNIIEKVSGRRYSYRFVLSKRTRRYINSHFVFDLPVENETEDERPIDSCEEDNDADEDDAINLKDHQRSVDSAPAILLPARNEYKGEYSVAANNDKDVHIGAKLTAAPCRAPTKVTGAAGCDQVSKRESDIGGVKSEGVATNDRFASESSKVGGGNLAAKTTTRIFKPDELLSRGINFNFEDDFLPWRDARDTLLGYNLLLSPEKRSCTDEGACQPPMKKGKLCDGIVIPPVNKVSLFDGDDVLPVGKDASFFVSPKVDRVKFCNRHNMPPLENRVNIREYDFLLASQRGGKPCESQLRGSIFCTQEGTSRVLREVAKSSFRPLPALVHVPRTSYARHLAGLYSEREQWDEGEGRCRHSFRHSISSLSDNGSEGGDSISSYELCRSPELPFPYLRRYSDHYRVGFTDLRPERADSRRCISVEESPLHVAFPKPPRTQLSGARSFDSDNLRYRLKPGKRIDPFMESSLISDFRKYPRSDYEAIFRPSAL